MLADDRVAPHLALNNPRWGAASHFRIEALLIVVATQQSNAGVRHRECALLSIGSCRLGIVARFD